MKRITTALALVTLVVLSACNNYGTKLKFKKGELYYTKVVTEAEANKLGNYLVKLDIFTDARTVTGQYDKKGDTMLFRFVVLDSFINKKDVADEFSLICIKLSRDVNNNKPVIIHFCNDHLETQKVVEAPKELVEAFFLGKWLCSKVEGSMGSDPERVAAEVKELKKNFTFTFNEDYSFHSDFVNDEDPTKPTDLKGTFGYKDGKLTLSDLIVNGQKSENPSFTFAAKKDGADMIFSNKTNDGGEIRIWFSPVNN